MTPPDISYTSFQSVEVTPVSFWLVFLQCMVLLIAFLLALAWYTRSRDWRILLLCASSLLFALTGFPTVLTCAPIGQSSVVVQQAAILLFRYFLPWSYNLAVLLLLGYIAARFHQSRQPTANNDPIPRG